jgi:hypothetical protein
MLIALLECRNRIHVSVLWMGLFGVATTRFTIWKTACLSLQPFGDNGKRQNILCHNLLLTNIGNHGMGTLYKEQRDLDSK